MATKTIARPRTPVSPDGNAQGPADLLENTLTQLESLLWVCHGEGIDWVTGERPRHLDNVFWIAADLASKAVELFQLSETAMRNTPEVGAGT